MNITNNQRKCTDEKKNDESNNVLRTNFLIDETIFNSINHFVSINYILLEWLFFC